VLSWDDVESIIRDLLPVIGEHVGDVITEVIPVGRGGLVPAAMLAYALQKPIKWMISLDLDLPKRVDDAMCLVVDDICDTGDTIERVRMYFPHAFIVTLCAHRSADPLPDVWGLEAEDDQWTTFPWSPDDYKEVGP
jgi:hypoxanthine phosphoribosyltransferase